MFLPTTKEEVNKLNWDKPDIILISGDVYIDSPFNGSAVIGNWLTIHGFKVAIIAQPDINTSDIKIEEELGDILFSCTNLSRFLKKDSEKALTFAINKFIIRFSSVEALLEADGKSFSDVTQDELNNYWEKAKKDTVI